MLACFKMDAQMNKWILNPNVIDFGGGSSAPFISGAPTPYLVEKSYAVRDDGNNTVNHANQAALAIFPNPFSDQLTANFQLTEASFVELRITDLNGRLTMHPFQGVPMEKGKYTVPLDLSSLAAGVYTLHFSGGNSSAVQRIVKFQ
jgi:hypothetical protein